MAFLITIRSNRSKQGGVVLRIADVLGGDGSSTQPLARSLADPAASLELRLLLRTIGSSGELRRLSDAELVAEAQRLLRTGELVLDSQVFRPILKSSSPALRQKAPAPPPPPAPAPRQAAPATEEPEAATFLPSLDSLAQAVALEAAAATGAPFCPT